MGRIITDPKKLRRNQVRRPSSEELCHLAGKTSEELTDKARVLRNARELESYPNFRRYVGDCLEATARKLMAIRSLRKNYFPEAGSMFRDLTETVVDLFWVYSYFRRQNSTGERMAERFYEFAAHRFLKTVDLLKAVAPKDHFLKEVYTENRIKELEDDAKRQLQACTLIDPNANSQLRKLQDRDWRALPGVIACNSEVHWRSRCRKATALAEDVANLRKAPYYENLKVLSSFTHWDPAQTLKLGEKEQGALADRDLNIALGYAHDVLNLAYKLLGIDPPEEVSAMRLQFIYMST